MIELDLASGEAPELLASLVKVAADADVATLLRTVGERASITLDSDFVSISIFEPDTWAPTRIFSTRPDAFPIRRRKPINETSWTD